MLVCVCVTSPGSIVAGSFGVVILGNRITGGDQAVPSAEFENKMRWPLQSSSTLEEELSSERERERARKSTRERERECVRENSTFISTQRK